MKKIIVAGGTGHIGLSLVHHLIQTGYSVRVLTRTTSRKDTGIRYIYWDGKTLDSWAEELEGADVLINLCGKSVDCRYTKSNKLKLIESRVTSTRLLGQAVSACNNPPSLWINASSSAFYGFSDKIVNEYGGAGDDFPASICMKWEEAFFSFATPRTRKIAWRLGIVLQPGRGLIVPFIRLARSGMGGRLGSGNQYFTWIHERDFLNVAVWTIAHPSAEGVYNVSSPEPVTNADFMSALRKAIRIPFGVPLPQWAVHVGGAIIGTEAYLILKGRRVVPDRLIDSGFRFQYSTISESLSNLFERGKG